MPSEAHQDALDRTTTRMTEDPLRVTSPYRQRDIHGFVQAFSKTVAAGRPLRLEATTARLLPPCRGFSQRPSGVLFDLSAGLDSTRPATRRRHPGTRPRCGPEPSHSFSLATTTTCIPAKLRGCQNRPHLAPGHAPRLAGLAPRRPTEVPRLPDARLRGSRGDPDAEDHADSSDTDDAPTNDLCPVLSFATVRTPAPRHGADQCPRWKVDFFTG